MSSFLTKQRLLAALAAFLFFAAWNRGLSLLYGMFALVVATIVIARLWPRFALNDLTGRRWHAATAFEDDAIELHYELRNEGWRTRRMVEVEDRVSAAPPNQQRPVAFLAKIARRMTRRFSYRVTCDKRGDYMLGPIVLRSGFPLGLTVRERPLLDTQSSLLVYPRTFPIVRLPLMANAHASLRGTETLSSAGGNEDFFGTREYRPGDSPRFIHWRSSARHGELIVKEFEQRGATEVNVLLDLHRDTDAGEGKQSVLEYAVKIAASIGEHALTHGHEVQLLGYGDRPTIVPVGRGPQQLARMLDALARVQADGVARYPHAMKWAATHMREGSTAVLLTIEPESDTAGAHQALAMLRANRVRVLAVLLDRASFTGHAVPSQQAAGLYHALRVLGAPVYRVRRGDAFGDIFA